MVNIKIAEQYGSYQLVCYSDMVAIEFSNKSVGLTLETFENFNDAMTVFIEVIEVLPESKTKRYNKKIQEAITNMKHSMVLN